MKKRLHIQTLLAIFAVGMIFSSCGDIDIVKRKYRPGFHVDITKNKKKNKGAQETAVADSRKAKKMKRIKAKKPKVKSDKIDDSLTASSGKATPDSKSIKKKKIRDPKLDKVLEGFKSLDFKQWIRDAKNGIRPDKSAVAESDWMSWVSFGTGIGAAAFGFFALLFAILFGWSYFVWIALILAGAAITFYILHKKNGGSSSFAKLGFILGIVGAGLAFIAMIIWIVYLALALGALI